MKARVGHSTWQENLEVSRYGYSAKRNTAFYAGWPNAMTAARIAIEQLAETE